MTKAEFDALIASINTETNRIAAALTAAVEALKAGGMSAADESAVFAELTAAADALRLVGAEPVTPPVTPVEPTPVEPTPVDPAPPVDPEPTA